MRYTDGWIGEMYRKEIGALRAAKKKADDAEQGKRPVGQSGEQRVEMGSDEVEQKDTATQDDPSALIMETLGGQSRISR